MSRYDLVTMAVAMDKRSSGDTSPATAKEILNMAKRADLIVEIHGEIQAADEAIADAGLERLQQVLDWRETQYGFGEYVAGLTVDIALAERKNIQVELDRAIKSNEKALDDESAVNDQYYNQVLTLAAKDSYHTGKNKDAKMWRGIIDSDPFNLPEKYIDVSKARNFNAKTLLFDALNKATSTGPGLEVVKIDPGTKKITNIKELQDWKNPDNPLIVNGWMSAGEVKALLGPDRNGRDQLSLYNKSADVNATTRREVQNKLNEARTASAELDNQELDGASILAVVDRASQAMGSIEEAAERGGSFDFKNQVQLQEELKQFDETKASRDRLVTLQKELAAKKPSAAAVFKREMAVVLSSPSNVAWARDNGFSELGRITLVDGKLDIDSYVAGRDDLAMVRAFNRQQERGEGRYGFKSIGTGDIVQFNLNGESVTGERLKYHAWDPAGHVRVLVPGQPEHLILKPGDVDVINVIERKPDKKSPQVKRAERRLVFVGGKIATAREGSRTRISEVDAAMVGDKYLIDKTGRHVTDADLAPEIDELLAQDRVVAKVVDGEDYIIDSDGNVSRIEPRGSVAELSPENDSDLIDRVRSAQPRRVAVSVIGSDGETTYRPVTEADVAKGVFGSDSEDFAFEIIEGELDFDAEAEAAVFDPVDDQARQIATDPKRLGLTAVDTFNPTRGAEYGDVTEVAGQMFRDVERGPAQPIDPGPPATPDDSPSANAAEITRARLDTPGGAADLGDGAGAERGDDPPLGDESIRLDRSEAGEQDDRDEFYDRDPRQGVEDENIRMAWNAANSKALEDGTPTPEIPVGWVVGPDGGLQKRTSQPSSVVTTTGSDGETTYRPAPTGFDFPGDPVERPPDDLGDTDLKAITEEPPAPKPKPTPKQKPTSDELAKQKAALADKTDLFTGFDMEAHLKKKKEPEAKEDEKRAKLGDVLKQLVTPKKFAAKKEEEEEQKKQKSLEDLGGVFSVQENDDEVIEGQVGAESGKVVSAVPPGKSGVPPTQDEIADQRDENERTKIEMADKLEAQRKARGVLNQPTPLLPQSGGE